MRKRLPAGQQKTTCSKCNGQLEDTRVGKYRYCRACHAEHMRKTRPKHKDLPPLQRKKANVRAYTKEYIKRGALKKLPCSVCGDANSQIHHPDYDKPLEVVWLCRKHHLELHEAEKTKQAS